MEAVEAGGTSQLQLDGSSGSGFSSKPERKKSYISKAKSSFRHHAPPPIWASAHDVGSTFGIGLGLYLRLLTWLMLMFSLLMLASVPYLVTINNAVFTDADHKDSFEFGVKVYPNTQWSSLTFGAIVGSSMDNNSLTYMNVNIGNQWNGPMKKSTFLKWISYVDACTSFLLLLGMILMMYLARRFCRTVDLDCLEVSDFTVLVQGLPRDASPQEVGEHFSRWGAVVEAHLVLDMGWILDTCSRVTHLQQRLQLLQDDKPFQCSETSFHSDSGALESKLQQSVSHINQMCSQPLPLKLALVTYNDLASVKRCLQSCPSGCVSSWFMRDAERFSGRRFWVSQASPPEDYLYENLSCSRLSRFIRKVFTRGVVLLTFLITAAIITGLSNYDTSNSNSLQWDSERLSADTQAAISLSLLPHNTSLSPTTTQAAVSLLTHNTSLSLANVTSLCAQDLPGSCTSYWAALYGSSLRMSFGSLLRWGNVTEGLVNLRPALKAMQAAQLAGVAGAGPGNNSAVAPCFPCYCLGLEQAPHNADPAWRTATSAECPTYINSYNLTVWGLSAAIALVITALNLSLKYLMNALLAFERHWTRSGLEWWYAVMAFTAQLLNTAVVLLLVNSSQLKDASVHMDQGGSSFLRHVMLDGQFDDFDQLWYESVGKAILIFVMINALNPVTSIVCDFTLRYIKQCWTMRCVQYDVQRCYDQAFACPDFNLQERVSDVMLSVTIGLMFGSGIPMLYLAVLVSLVIQAVVDRYCIARACHVSSRYAEHLPTLVINWLPWALLLHCCFGLWMHTFFLVDDGDNASSVVLNSGAKLLTQLSASSADDVSHSSAAQRITQPNGLPLLFVAILIVVWLLWRHLFSFFRKLLGRLCCLMYHKLRNAGRFQDLQLAPTYRSDPGADQSYEQALLSGALQGAPTYRIHHHPTYSHLFAGSTLTKAVWYRATGTQAFTRLVSCGVTGLFQVAPQVCTSLDTSDLHLEAASQSQLGSHLSYLVDTLSVTTNLKGISSHALRSNLSQQDTTQARDCDQQATACATAAAQPLGSQPVQQVVHIQVMAEGEPLPAEWWSSGGGGDEGGQPATAVPRVARV